MRYWTMALLGAATLFGGCTTVRQLRPPETIPVSGKAEKTRDKHALDYSVAIRIDAAPHHVWDILTDAAAYTTWNSTVVSLNGVIKPGEKLKLVSKVAPDRTFKLLISGYEPPMRLVWEDGGASFLGVRTFTLTDGGDGSTSFVMSETFSGGMLGMIEPKLPDFTRSFEDFAADLKKAAEARAAEERAAEAPEPAPVEANAGMEAAPEPDAAPAVAPEPAPVASEPK